MAEDDLWRKLEETTERYKEVIEEEGAESVGRSFDCEECGRSFASQSKLEDHYSKEHDLEGDVLDEALEASVEATAEAAAAGERIGRWVLIPTLILSPLILVAFVFGYTSWPFLIGAFLLALGGALLYMDWAHIQIWDPEGETLQLNKSQAAGMISILVGLGALVFGGSVLIGFGALLVMAFIGFLAFSYSGKLFRAISYLQRYEALLAGLGVLGTIAASLLMYIAGFPLDLIIVLWGAAAAFIAYGDFENEFVSFAVTPLWAFTTANWVLSVMAGRLTLGMLTMVATSGLTTYYMLPEPLGGNGFPDLISALERTGIALIYEAEEGISGAGGVPVPTSFVVLPGSGAALWLMAFFGVLPFLWADLAFAVTGPVALYWFFREAHFHKFAEAGGRVAGSLTYSGGGEGGGQQDVTIEPEASRGHQRPASSGGGAESTAGSEGLLESFDQGESGGAVPGGEARETRENTGLSEDQKKRLQELKSDAEGLRDTSMRGGNTTFHYYYGTLLLNLIQDVRSNQSDIPTQYLTYVLDAIESAYDLLAHVLGTKRNVDLFAAAEDLPDREPRPVQPSSYIRIKDQVGGSIRKGDERNLLADVKSEVDNERGSLPTIAPVKEVLEELEDSGWDSIGEYTDSEFAAYYWVLEALTRTLEEAFENDATRDVMEQTVY